MNIHALLVEKIHAVLISIGIPSSYEVKIHQSTKIQFGHYQIDSIMSLAKHMNIPSMFLAEKIVKLLNLNNIADKIDIIYPGFINIFLSPKWLEKKLAIAVASSRLSIKKVSPPKTIVIDYSSPNIAKEMHIGHLRSTVLGDVIVRILNFLGHKVIKANHIGDWGTQFGMLIAYFEKIKNNNYEDNMELSNLEQYYCKAQEYYNNNLEFAEYARYCVAKLHHEDSNYLKIWKKLVDITIKYNQNIYHRLNVTLTKNDIMGESKYNSMLPSIVLDLKQKGLAYENEGAIVITLNEFKNKQGKDMGVILQKKDGAYLYSTIDLACLKYRCETLKANRIIYYIDARQKQHIMQIWTIAYKAGYIPKSTLLEYHSFGMILGKDGKPFKTRNNNTIKLSRLLDEAIERARKIIITKNPCINIQNLEKIVKIIGIGALKYSELSKNRTTNYIFDWDSMLSFEGNTSPYIQYAYVRIISIFQNIGQDMQNISGKIQLNTTEEIQLAVRLLQLEETIFLVAKNGIPHVLCAYLYDISVLFSIFYEKCPIIYYNNQSIRNSRLQLASLTARTIKTGLFLLGIETVDIM